MNERRFPGCMNGFTPLEIHVHHSPTADSKWSLRGGGLCEIGGEIRAYRLEDNILAVSVAKASLRFYITGTKLRRVACSSHRLRRLFLLCLLTYYHSNGRQRDHPRHWRKRWAGQCDSRANCFKARAIGLPWPLHRPRRDISARSHLRSLTRRPIAPARRPIPRFNEAQ